MHPASKSEPFKNKTQEVSKGKKKFKNKHVDQQLKAWIKIALFLLKQRGNG